MPKRGAAPRPASRARLGSQGRGRGGREWISQPGNLFASLLIGVNCPIRVAGQLALVAGVIAYDTVAKLVAY